MAREGREVLCADCRQRARAAPPPAPARSPAGSEATPAGTADPESAQPPDSPWVAALRHEIESWCAGRNLWVRLPLLIWFLLILARHWANPEYQSLFKPLNLGIHELGHYLFAAFGNFMAVAGGSLAQCLAPLASMIMFWRQPDYFAIAVCFGWLGTNCFDVAVYAGDARSMALPLVTPGGGEPIHDWNWLLARMGMLEWDRTIEILLRLLGSASLLAGTAAGGWMLWVMYRNPTPRPH